VNDIIKLNKDLVCYSSVSFDKEILYIVMLTFFENSGRKIKIRYYVVKMFDLYHYKFYSGFRLDYYANSFITLTSSVCREKNCGNTYSSLIIFGYPNSHDYYHNIVSELFDKNEINLNNLTIKIDLFKHVNIENNIFGYVSWGIIIKSFQNCDKIELIRPTNFIRENQFITAKFKNMNYELINCTFEYIYYLKESEYSEFDNFADNIITIYGDDNEDIFNEKARTYAGRLSYYYLYLQDELIYLKLNF
jgi:hypothetical protein